MQVNPALVAAPRTDPGWRERHDAQCARAARHPADLIFVGDSITHCFGGEPRTGEAFQDRGEATWRRLYAPRRALNLGIWGDRTEHVLWRLRHGALGATRPKAFVVLIGTNNLFRDTAGDIAAGVDAVLAELSGRRPRAKSLLLALFPRDAPGSAGRARAAAVNALLPEVARRRGAAYLDIGARLIDRRGALRPELWLDPVHPGAAGYAVWGDAMEPVLARLMR